MKNVFVFKVKDLPRLTHSWITFYLGLNRQQPHQSVRTVVRLHVTRELARSCLFRNKKCRCSETLQLIETVNKTCNSWKPISENVTFKLFRFRFDLKRLRTKLWRKIYEIKLLQNCFRSYLRLNTAIIQLCWRLDLNYGPLDRKQLFCQLSLNHCPTTANLFSPGSSFNWSTVFCSSLAPKSSTFWSTLSRSCIWSS